MDNYEGKALTEGLHVRSLMEFAALAGISIANLRRVIARGDGPTITRLSPRRIGIRHDHGREWLDQQSQAAGRPD